jgi:benzil reductase ((S)-benzoin forming)
LKIIRPEAWQQIALVNNVGQLDPIAAIQDIDFAELEQSFQLNTVLPIWLMGFCRRIWPSKKLTIVNISSGAATKPYQGWGAYCSTKAALRMAGQVFAAEQAARKQPAAVYAYAPGVLDTSMQSKVRGSDPSVFADLPRFKSLYEQGELIHPDLPARHIVSLIDKSDDRQSGFFELRFERDEHA